MRGGLRSHCCNQVVELKIGPAVALGASAGGPTLAGESLMTGDMVKILLVGALVLVSIVCIFGPLAVLAVMFWNWHRELRQTARLRLARSTQVR